MIKSTLDIVTNSGKVTYYMTHESVEKFHEMVQFIIDTKGSFNINNNNGLIYVNKNNIVSLSFYINNTKSISQ